MVRSFLPLLLADIDLRCRLRTLARDGHIQSCVPYQRSNSYVRCKLFVAFCHLTRVHCSLPVAAPSTSQYDRSSTGQKVNEGNEASPTIILVIKLGCY
jgi:hypothetical protein